MRFLALVLCLTFPHLSFGLEKPNVVLILSDDVGIGDIGSYYPATKVSTPHIDRLASQGMRFTQAYANGAVCSPTRYALLSGAYPCRGPLRLQPARYTTPLTISPDAVTLPRFLKQQGYRTACIGKWHLGFGTSSIDNWAGPIKPGPPDIGFDYSLVLPTNHSDGFKTYVENHHLKWLKDNVDHLDGKPDKDQLTQIRYDDEVDSTLTAAAIDFMKETRLTPFFVYLPLVATHTHVTPRVDFRGTSQIGQLGDYIHELDAHVGEIMTAIDDMGEAENTIVIFTSDNGGMKSDAGNAGNNLDLRDASLDVALKSRTAKVDAREKFGHKTNRDLQGYKGSTYEGGFRVPFIVRWPDRVPAGSQCDQLLTLADMLATTAGFLQQPLPDSAGVDSFDFSDVMLGKETARPVRTTAVLQTGRGVLAFRLNDWKLRFTKAPTWSGSTATLPNGACELYDLSQDPGETNDVADAEPKRVEDMREILSGILNRGSSKMHEVRQ